MKSSGRFSFSSSTQSTTTTTITYTIRNDQTTPPSNPNSAAAKIQSSYRAHMIRRLYKKISAVDSEADELERTIQRQETVDAVRSEERERLRMNESLMRLLLKLDSVPGWDPAVRDARRKVSRRIVGLQEILDSITADTELQHFGGVGGYFWECQDFVAELEEQVCRYNGGHELDAFCDQYLGFRCLQRFLSQS